jgi:hypothetical protein
MSNTPAAHAELPPGMEADMSAEPVDEWAPMHEEPELNCADDQIEATEEVATPVAGDEVDPSDLQPFSVLSASVEEAVAPELSPVWEKVVPALTEALLPHGHLDEQQPVGDFAAPQLSPQDMIPSLPPQDDEAGQALTDPEPADATENLSETHSETEPGNESRAAAEPASSRPWGIGRRRSDSASTRTDRVHG